MQGSLWLNRKLEIRLRYATSTSSANIQGIPIFTRHVTLFAQLVAARNQIDRLRISSQIPSDDWLKNRMAIKVL